MRPILQKMGKSEFRVEKPCILKRIKRGRRRAFATPSTRAEHELARVLTLGHSVLSQLRMAAVAERRVLRMLAQADRHFLLFLNDKLLRSEGRSFVRPVTHGLIAGEPAGAPPVLAGFDIHDLRIEGGRFRLVHDETYA